MRLSSLLFSLLLFASAVPPLMPIDETGSPKPAISAVEPEMAASAAKMAFLYNKSGHRADAATPEKAIRALL
jgi:hypothetical protein